MTDLLHNLGGIPVNGMPPGASPDTEAGSIAMPNAMTADQQSGNTSGNISGKASGKRSGKHSDKHSDTHSVMRDTRGEVEDHCSDENGPDRDFYKPADISAGITADIALTLHSEDFAKLTEEQRQSLKNRIRVVVSILPQESHPAVVEGNNAHVGEVHTAYGSGESREMSIPVTSLELHVEDSDTNTSHAAELPVARRAVIAMQSKVVSAEHLFQSAVVTLDAAIGNQVEGISPLYHVSNIAGSDSMAAVMQVSTKFSPRQLANFLRDIAASHEDMLTMRLVDFEGLSRNTSSRADRAGIDSLSNDGAQDTSVLDEGAANSAAVLAPWLDMDPEAKLGKDSVGFLLALAPDSMNVGMLSDNWIMGADL